MKITKERIKHELKEHLADSTSTTTLAMPINTAIELFGAGMTNDVSINSRIYNLGLTYGGLSRLIKLRDYSKRKFNVDNLPELAKISHDIALGLAISPIVKTGIYLAAGEDDWKKIAIGVLGGMGAIGVLSAPLGYAIDIGRDLWGVKESPRTPKKLQNKSSRFKKAVAIGCLAASIAVTSGIYAINHYRNNDTHENSSLVEMVENPNESNS